MLPRPIEDRRRRLSQTKVFARALGSGKVVGATHGCGVAGVVPAAQCPANSTRWRGGRRRCRRAATIDAAAAQHISLSLDGIAGSVITESGTTRRLGYRLPGVSICASINDRVVHGIPSAARCVIWYPSTAVLDDWHGDAITFGVGA